MRVISQDGTIDVPYENVVVQRYKSDIYFLNRNLTGIKKLVDDINLAKYSTEEKAIKAMELLREVYLYHTSISVKNGNANGAIKFARVFQFPQDDEIEV